MPEKTIRFTIDNEEVHKVSLTLENEGLVEGKARTQFPDTLRSVAHSPSDEMAVRGQPHLLTTQLIAKSA